MHHSLTKLFKALTLLSLSIGCTSKSVTRHEQRAMSGTADSYVEQGNADGMAIPASMPSSRDQIQTSRGPEAVNERSLAWRTPETAPLSTVSIDVDTASYTRTRAIIRAGGTPVADRVRPEDFINYFPYSYTAPTDARLVNVHQELVPSPWTPGAQILSLGLKAKDLGLVDPPRNLVFLVDVSGSMASEDKLPLVKASLVKLTDSLRAEDRIALVTYAGYTEVVLNATAGTEKDTIKQAIARLGAGGGTNGGSGINLAYEIAQKQFMAQAVNRVILTTDGDFNLGITQGMDLVTLIRSKADAGIFLSILGFGTDGNDPLMEQLARDANGNYFFIDSTKEIDKVFGSDLKGNIVTVAKDVKIQIEFNPRLVQSYRLIGYAERILRDDEFNQDTRDAGDLGSGQTVTYLYEITPRPATDVFVGTYQPSAGVDPLIYQSSGAVNEAAARAEIGTLKIRYKTPEGLVSTKEDSALLSTAAPVASVDVQWQLALAETAVILGRIKGLEGSLTAAKIRAESALGSDETGLRREFLDLLTILTKPVPLRP